MFTSATAQSLCSPRNGTGANPAGFACTTEPLIGTSWNTTVDIVTPGAAASALGVFLGGPLDVPTPLGELLCAFPELMIDIAFGSHSIGIPNDTTLLGQTFCTQAATLDFGPLQVQLQNAIDLTIGAFGIEDISVLVLQDDGDDSTPLVPVSGAQVTLRGTDPASSAGLSLTTNASGLATFTGVAGPYSVTAQTDIVSPGLTTRVASSVVGILPAVTGSPPAGTIGVLIVAELEVSPTIDALLSGTVSNLPTLTGTEFIQVAAVANGSQVDFEEFTFVDPVTGFYSMPIPSGVDLDCHVTHRADFGLPSSAVLASLLQPGVGQTGPGTTLTRNFDFASPAVVPWTTPVGLSVSNVDPALGFGLQLLVVDRANGVDFDFSFFDGASAPASINLPDVTDPSFAGFEIDLDSDTFDPFGIGGGQDCNTALSSTPAAVAFDLIPLPTLLQPSDLATLTLPELEDLNVLFTEGSPGSFGDNGVNLFSIVSEEGASGPPPPGIDQALWTVFAPAGVESFELPPLSLPMFATNQNLFVSLEQLRFDGFTFTYEGFFDGNLSSNLDALNGTSTGGCSSSVEIDIFLVP